MSAESADPSGAAKPIGYRVSGHLIDAIQAPGILMRRIDNRL